MQADSFHHRRVSDSERLTCFLVSFSTLRSSCRVHQRHKRRNLSYRSDACCRLQPFSAGMKHGLTLVGAQGCAWGRSTPVSKPGLKPGCCSSGYVLCRMRSHRQVACLQPQPLKARTAGLPWLRIPYQQAVLEGSGAGGGSGPGARAGVNGPILRVCKTVLTSADCLWKW